MRILYLCQLVPYPADAGPKVRAYYTLRYLAERHAVTLAAFGRPDDRAGAVEHLREFCEAVHTVPIRRGRLRDGLTLLACLASGRSFIIERDRVAAMNELVDELLASGAFEAVHADQLWMAQYALRAKRVGGKKILTVLDEHNACFQIVERLAAGEENPLKRLVLQRERGALRRFEARALGQFDQLATVTEEDRWILERLAEEEGGKRYVFGQNSHTIPICVDTEELEAVRPGGEAQDVLHLGTMFWPPNVEGVVWFGRDVWPRVKAEVPGARLTIAGKNPPGEVKALEADPSVRVTGYVVDPLPYLEQAGAFIVPLFAGSGMRVKILDGWRLGLPVISTTIGAEGIEYLEGENILIADDPEAFAAAVVRVLRDGGLNAALRVNGRRWVEERYDWRRIYPAWDEVYSE